MSLNTTIPTSYGEQWRTAHLASVRAILGNDAPPVISMGSRFYNIDRWTGRFLLRHICAWAKSNPGAMPLHKDVASWVKLANDEKLTEMRRIVIAATPPTLSSRVLFALVGGGYHEALHTLLSCRRDLKVDEVADIVLPRWAKLKDWSKFHSLLLEWTNIVEDIRIERAGVERFVGIHLKMCALQDFILDQERVAQQQALAKNQKAGEEALQKPLPVISAAFRDLGLDYQTTQQAEALKEYERRNADAFALVEHGPLRQHLDAARALDADDVMGCLRVAMDVLIELAHLVEGDHEDAEGEEDGEGTHTRPQCPNCGAPGKDLIVRPIANGKDRVVPAKGVITCTKCGWQDIVQLTEGGGAGPTDPDDVVQFDSTPFEADSGGGGDSSESGERPVHEDVENDDASVGAGGHHSDPERAKAWQMVADAVLKDAQGGARTNLQDVASALQSVFEAIHLAERKQCLKNELPWRPYDLSNDTVQLVQSSNLGMASDQERIANILQSVRAECVYLRTRLRAIVRAVSRPVILHGTRRGKDISERMLVEAVADLRSGHLPTRPYYDVTRNIDTNAAVVLIIDESSSMGMSSRKLQNTTRGIVALTDALDFIEVATMVVGFRDGEACALSLGSDVPTGTYHRFHGVHIDVFKRFDERFSTVKWRFANTRAIGGTPMADGVQFGLEHLRARPESRRILFVATDGEPNPGHDSVIRRQIRQARNEEIAVIGIGIGRESQSVMRLFPDHIWIEHVAEMPSAVILKLNKVFDFRGLRRTST